MWARDRQTVPPMEFGHLLVQVEDNEQFMTALGKLLAEKALAMEGAVIPLVPVIQDFIAVEMERCRAAIFDVDKPSHDTDLLDMFFRKMLTP